ncbi:MAG: Crp/Fnr family transcriptional regulator [Rhodoferax sp.]|uniref:Crp/Fnr family transcriptional regulator n=1 Tax=Rhodoferax sp. TaxID=50421 RepID=UPI00271CDE15|nr:Crp/Fnr family transcriptional regulator [Rhodoferax sp.]MDO8449341.1 Crp/Fnr family transcriptional regulator [Rhodoferax sp.]
MIPIKIESAYRGTADCRHCGIRDMVLFGDLDEPDFDMLHVPIDQLELKEAASLYAERSPSQGIFTLRTGMIKLVRVTTDGRQRIVRVLRPGDVAGLEALATSRYDSEAVALTDVAVCRIPLDVIHTLEASSEHLHRRLTLKWQQALKEADDWLADLNFGTARQRVCNFILKMRSPTDSRVAMLFSRDDMGAMLDLKPETISREVTRLVREEVIEPLDKLGRIYRVLQLERLQTV